MSMFPIFYLFLLKRLYSFLFSFILIFTSVSLLINELFSQPHPFINRQRRQWKIDYEKSIIRFSIPLLFSKIEGEVKSYRPIKNFYNGDYRSLIQNGLKIQSQDIRSKNITINGELYSKSFLNIKEYPEVKIIISELNPISKNSEFYFITLKLQIKNIQKEYTNIIQIRQTANQQELSGVFVIPRRDFHLKGNLLLDYILLGDYIDVYYYILVKNE